MKHIWLSIMLLLGITSSYAQAAAPSWMNPTMRERFYSAEDYFTGYVPGNIRANEGRAEALERVKSDAQSELVRSIRVLVQTYTEKKDQQLQADENFLFASLYKSAAKTTAEAEIVGVKIDSYYDVNDNLVYGFAYLEREVMVKYYQNQIIINLQKIMDAIQSAKQFNDEGLKVKARQMCKEAVSYFTNIEYAQDILTAVDNNATPTSLYLSPTSELRRDLITLTASMSQKFVVYIKIYEENFRTPSAVLINKLKSIITQSECGITSNSNDADITLVIEATTRRHDVADNEGIKFAYADIVIKVLNTLTDRELFADEISIKGGAMSYENAGRKALEESASKVWEKINHWIE